MKAITVFFSVPVEGADVQCEMDIRADTDDLYDLGAAIVAGIPKATYHYAEEKAN